MRGYLQDQKTKILAEASAIEPKLLHKTSYHFFPKTNSLKNINAAKRVKILAKDLYYLRVLIAAQDNYLIHPLQIVNNYWMRLF